MILGGTDREAAGNRTTLDDLFRRAGVRHSAAMALIDPPNREIFTDGTPRRLTYAQADRAISAFAARLRQLGLQTDTVVALHLPHTVESIIALLGVLRAGMIAAPLPLLWRQQDIVAALGRIGAKVIVTTARIGISSQSTSQSTSLAEIAMQAAAELFPIRYVCSFGLDLPDGVMPLDDIFGPDQLDLVPSSARPGNAAAHVAVVTFETGAAGLVPVARNHIELIAGGLSAYLESGAVLDANVLSAIQPGSFASIALGVVPWLLGGGALTLHHAYDPATFADQYRTQNGGSIALPGPALAPLAEAGHLGNASKTIVALWRSPERIPGNPPWHGDARLVDVASFGEYGLLAAQRGADGMPAAIAIGLSGTAPAIETLRTDASTVALRGAMVPAYAFPPGAERGPEPHLKPDAAGFVDTGVRCGLNRDTNTLTITGSPAGITSIGGYRFRQNAVDWMVAEVDLDATIVALPDAVLDQRLAGTAPDREATEAHLLVRGVNPLIAGAFRPRGAAKAA